MKYQFSESYAPFCHKYSIYQTEPRDYVTSNAIEQILADPRKVESLPKNYLEKPDFGKIPAYLRRIKRDIEKENALALRLKAEEEAARRAKQRALSDEERTELTEGLRRRWNSLNAEYQKMTHMTALDTIGKVQRKEHFEKELDQVERDLKLLARNEPIFVDLEH